jgi:type I restriction enzyme S subunit
MNNWPYRPLSELLTEREGRFKPNDAEIASYKRIDKIDFSGQIHISEKPSKTDMIIIEPGDLVISGINVAKGALAVYEGNEPVTATIHYSSYIFNKDQIDIAFLKRFLRSPAFISELRDQVKGGIKTEIKPKHFLSLNAMIPGLTEQKKINNYFDAIENEITELSNEVNTQSTYLSKLRQSILQEAIEGKLTADWRNENPVRKGDPDYDAEALLEKIKFEKEKLVSEEKIKNQKPLTPIKTDEVPFELPEGWVWTRLNYLTSGSQPITYGIVKMGDEPKVSGVYVLRCSDILYRKISLEKVRRVTDKISNQYTRTILNGDEILLNVRGTLGGCAVTNTQHAGFNIAREVSMIVLHNKDMNYYLLNVLTSPFFNKEIEKNLRGIAYKGLNLNLLQNFLIPTPPLAEQQAIVYRVEKLLSMVDELEKQVSEIKEQSEQLKQVVLREAFEGGV